MFKKYDLDGDKQIDTAEFQAFMSAVSACLRMRRGGLFPSV